MIGNPQVNFKTIDAHTIEVEAKEITDDHIYKLEGIRKRLGTYNISEMTWFEYDYEPYNSWGERPTITPSKRKYENYEELLNHLIKRSQDDRSHGWSNRINFLNITLKVQDEPIEKSDVDKKLDFIVTYVDKEIDETTKRMSDIFEKAQTKHQSKELTREESRRLSDHMFYYKGYLAALENLKYELK